MPKLISVGELIDTSWDRYRDTFVDLISISGWMLAPALLNIIALALNPLASKLATGLSTDVTLSGWEITGSLLFFVTNAIVTPVVGLWVFLSLALYVQSVLARSPLSPRAALMQGRALFWPGVLVSVLIFVPLVVALAIGIGPSIIIGLLSGLLQSGTLGLIATLLTGVGTLVALVLAVMWSVEFGLAGYTLVIERVRGVAALKRTRRLVLGRFFGTLVRVLVPNLVFVILGTVAVGIPMYFFTQVIYSASGINLDVQLRLLSMIGSVFPTIAAVLINPAVVIANVLLYRSLSSTRPAERA